jgi:hypothetical protein
MERVGFGQHVAGDDNAQPDFALIQFFDGNFEFVDKIGGTFGTTRLPWCAAGAVPLRKS